MIFARLNKRRLLPLTLLLALAATDPTSAQDDDQIVRGRAAVSPAMTLGLLKKIEGFCASADKSAREPLARAVTAWRERHADLLKENAKVRDELLAEVSGPTAPPQLKAELNQMLNVWVPEQIESDFKKSFPAEASKGRASMAFTCGAHAGLIDDGKYDLVRLDPELAAYLKRRILQATQAGSNATHS